jgi:hypothetical protein
MFLSFSPTNKLECFSIESALDSLIFAGKAKTTPLLGDKVRLAKVDKLKTGTNPLAYFMLVSVLKVFIVVIVAVS